MFNKKKWDLVWGCIALSCLLMAGKSFAWQLQYSPLQTGWAQLVDTNNPLPEYPRPQMVRTNWMNLNGLWQFQPGATNDPVPTNQTLSSIILVPFPMESAISGIAQYHAFSWYRRTFTVPSTWSGQHILLHLDAVDWQSQVYINGQSVGVHKGGYDAITYDITAYLTGNGPQELIVQVYSPEDNGSQPRGKQTLYPGGIMYTSSSGIWQPAWLEPVPATSVASLRLVPDIDNKQLNITVNVSGPTNGVTVKAVASNGTNLVGSVSGAIGTGLTLSIPNPVLWSPTNPFLYNLTVTLSNGPVQLDSVASYFGMRKISIGSTNGFLKMLLNNQFVFEFGPLDQGFWPDGIYTAPTDNALKSDIEQEKALGFNMVRKHIKVERARWYYWADKLGILVWQDMPSCNSYTGNPSPPAVDPIQFITELTNMVEKHWNSPAIIMWDIFNESQGQENTSGGVGQTNTAYLVSLVKSLDPSRLVNQASGGSYYGVGDVLDNHSYPDPGNPSSTTQAVVDGEFGGVALYITNHTWAPGGGEGSATNADDLASQFESFCNELGLYVQNDGLSAAVYTQTTDVETELNGLYTYDRAVRKPDPNRIQAAILSVSQPGTTTTIVPTSQTNGISWLYTTNTPASNWFTTNFSANSWSNGLAGFGAGNPPNTAGIVRTPWSTSDIWLRRTFNPGPLNAQQISNLVFYVYHDEDVEIYINGVLAGSAPGYTTTYVLLTMNSAGQSAILPNATNLMAVHVHQTTGGQFIDVGINTHSNIALALPTIPATPTNLIAVSGPSGVSLGWDSSANAINYNVKRSTINGGPYTNIMIAPLGICMDANVTNSTTYYYVVSATNSAGESANSAQISVTTASLPHPILMTWFKADSLIALTNGAAVSNWPDASGNGFNATQSTPNQTPKLATHAINGLPVVRFNSTNQTCLSFPRPVQDDFTIICVFQSTQGLNSGTLYYQGAGLVNGEVSGVVNDFGTCLFANGSVCAGTGNPDVAVNSAAGFNDGHPHIFTFTRTRSNGTIALYMDGTLAGTTNGGFESLTAPAQLVLGAQQTQLYFLTGDIAEAKIYNTALSTSDRMADESSLRCKYGLGSGTAPSAPNGLSAVAGNRQVLLTWNPAVGATGYSLLWSTNLNGPYISQGGSLTATNYVDGRAANGQTNYYVVESLDACGTSTNSPAVAVFLPLPTLGVSAGNSSLSLSWPDWANDWLLYSTTNLTPPISWSHVTNAATDTNGRLMIQLPINARSAFYRLSSP
jgi:Glycosyl hydrolases family 2, sugar binding domain/Glycosyl hydrolases family 2/Glycosyl hydrolases family 2, TIM barrel domain/Concanavalin A-like lectin/glucanases superfamily